MISAVLWIAGFDGDLKNAVVAAAVAGLGVFLLSLTMVFPRGAAGFGPWHPLSARDRARRGRTIRQTDPDAAGRPRPRAPSASPALA
ncbi:DUF6412 domain-containing protein [Sinosporangium album]|uniref:DUF6412 domain-containing protein n=1 Tax=Sinosporangium album TaxID=504805 RepID=UPI00115FF187|nr:DUF6412 domain-containing protein [Sinosporangium album]